MLLVQQAELGEIIVTYPRFSKWNIILDTG